MVLLASIKDLEMKSAQLEQGVYKVKRTARISSPISFIESWDKLYNHQFYD